MKQKGVLPPQLCIEPKIFFGELARKDIEVYQTLKEQIN